MYRYFLGPYCNRRTKKEGDPWVIKASKTVSRAIDEWVSKYHIDLDIFVGSLVSFLKQEVCEISIEDKKHCVLMMENQNIVFLELLHEEKPMCKVQTDNLNVVILVQEEFKLMRLFYEMGNKKITLTESMDKIVVEDETTLTTIASSQITFEFYAKLRDTLEKLDTLDNIPKLFFWIHVGKPKITDYVLSVSRKASNEEYITSFLVKNNCIINYRMVNEVGTYETNSDKSWKVEINGFFQEFDSQLKEYTIIVSQWIMNNPDYYKKLRKLMNESLDTMMKMHQLLNNTLQLYVQI